VKVQKAVYSTMVTYNNGRFIILLYLFRQRRMGRQVIITELCRGREGADCFFGYEPPSFPQEKRLRLPAEKMVFWPAVILLAQQAK
ncbi:MAG: hypothetical protein IIX37_00370, partial [Selenomonadaceae bacterium]|nr:hypothetical protein [Selenomonadaceae bacterium]